MKESNSTSMEISEQGSLQTLKVFYSKDMVSDAQAGRSPSDRKPQLVSEGLARGGWPIRLVAPRAGGCVRHLQGA